MEKIKLNDNCKRLLNEIKNGSYQVASDSDTDDVITLNVLGIIDITQTKDGIIIDGLTDEGRVYMHSNPDLKNPSIWDDKKYWINTAISVFALIVAIIALFKN